MNAIEFVKKFGIAKVKGIVFTMTSGFVNYDGISVNYDDLKQILDAFDCVMEHGSVEHAKKYAESDYTAPEVKQFLLKAINLVEQCNA